MAKVTGKKKAIRKKKVAPKKVETPEPVSSEEEDNQEAEALVERAAAATDHKSEAIEPEVDAEAVLQSRKKGEKVFPMDVWQNISDSDVKFQLEQPHIVRPGQKVKITSAYRRAMRDRIHNKMFGSPPRRAMRLIEGENINSILSADEEYNMHPADPEE